MSEQTKSGQHLSSLSLPSLSLPKEPLQGLVAKGSESISTISGKPGGLPSADSELWTSHPDCGQGTAVEDPDRMGGMLIKKTRVKNNEEPRGQIGV